jgi:hypothetical protein
MDCPGKSNARTGNLEILDDLGNEVFCRISTALDLRMCDVKEMNLRMVPFSHLGSRLTIAHAWSGLPALAYWHDQPIYPDIDVLDDPSKLALAFRMFQALGYQFASCRAEPLGDI